MQTDILLQRALNLEFLTAEEGVFLFENATSAIPAMIPQRLSVNAQKEEKKEMLGHCERAARATKEIKRRATG